MCTCVWLRGGQGRDARHHLPTCGAPSHRLHPRTARSAAGQLCICAPINHLHPTLALFACLCVRLRVCVCVCACACACACVCVRLRVCVCMLWVAPVLSHTAPMAPALLVLKPAPVQQPHLCTCPSLTLPPSPPFLLTLVTHPFPPRHWQDDGCDAHRALLPAACHVRGWSPVCASAWGELRGWAGAGSAEGDAARGWHA